MNIYHIYIDRKEPEEWFALALFGQDQVETLGKAFPDISGIETWNGDVVYKRSTVH